MEPNKRELIITPLALVETFAQEYLDADNYLPLGTVTIFSGRGSVGKTTFALDYVAQVSAGTLPGKYYGHPQNVLLVSHEDDPGTQLKPRLIAAGVNVDNVHLFSVRTHFGDVSADSMPSLTKDVDLIKQAIAEWQPALIVIDPLSSTIDGDLHKVADVRRALAPIMQLAQVNKLVVIALHHVNKGSGAASDKISGSHAFRDAARSVLLFARDDETKTTVVTLDKSNYTDAQGDSFQFQIVTCDVPTDDGKTASVGRVELLGKSDVSVSDIWQREHDQGDKEEQNETRAWLRGYLMDIGGSAASGDIRKAAQAEGHVWRTVQRAGKKLCDIKRTGFQGQTVWTLKEDGERGINDTPQGINDSKDSSRVSVTNGASVSLMAENPATDALARVF